MASSTSHVKHVLVVGGAGFLGSAITKRLLAQGHTVTSFSPSGRPFLTPSGHRPAWSSSPSVRWEKADAFKPETYQGFLTASPAASSSTSASYQHLPPVSAVVSTIGVLLEGDYKGTDSSVAATLKALARGWGLDRGNPLDETKEGLYEKMNRDAALSVARTWSSILASPSSPPFSTSPPPFIFISAEDIFRPIIDPHYISTKRQAEKGLEEMSWSTLTTSPRSSPSSADHEVETPDGDGAGLAEEINQSTNTAGEQRQSSQGETSPSRLFRPVFVRPGVMYHPHTRPISTVPAALLDLSSSIHSYLPSQAPTPANVLNNLLGQGPLARLLTLSPLHIDTVAKAVGAAVDDEGIWGVVNTRRIKQLAGFKSADLGREVYREREGPAVGRSDAYR